MDNRDAVAAAPKRRNRRDYVRLRVSENVSAGGERREKRWLKQIHWRSLFSKP